MPEPDVYLGIGSGSHAQQTASVMTAFEQVCLDCKPELVVVAGDVNSTLGCALVAAKLHIPVAHVESGLRSYDRDMPEEINRVLTDHISDLLFTTETSGSENLAKEGVSAEKIHFVGNSMIDTLYKHLEAAKARQPWLVYGVESGTFGLITFHRPSNVDEATMASHLVRALETINAEVPLIFPIHPRTRSAAGGVWRGINGVRIVEPLGYLDFLGLMACARIVITDSGGVQDETTALGVRCVTVRPNTERPVTITEGTNCLVSPDKDDIVAAVFKHLHDASMDNRSKPAFWDGKAGKRIVDVLAGWYQVKEAF